MLTEREASGSCQGGPPLNEVSSERTTETLGEDAGRGRERERGRRKEQMEAKQN